MRDLVVARWGEEVAPGGVVDRATVAAHAFSAPEERAWLEGVLWPRVGARVLAFREQASAQEPPPPAAVVETPLLFEAGMEAVYDATIAIVAPERLREERAGGAGTPRSPSGRRASSRRRRRQPARRTRSSTTEPSSSSRTAV